MADYNIQIKDGNDKVYPSPYFKKYTFPRQTFTFTSPFKSLGDYPSGVTADRIFSVYISYLGDNTGSVSVSLGSGSLYALGDVGKTMTNLEVTIVYI